MNHDYQDGLTVLVENKKLGMLTQDQFDQQHQDLIKQIFGDPDAQPTPETDTP